MSAESAIKTGMIPPHSPTTDRKKKEVYLSCLLFIFVTELRLKLN